jgi:hypothetical protein
LRGKDVIGKFRTLPNIILLAALGGTRSLQELALTLTR